MREYFSSNHGFSIQVSGFIEEETVQVLLGSWEEFLLGMDLPALRLWLRNQENIKLSLSISLLPDGQIQELNSQYRNKNYATDVLSFPLTKNLRDQIDEIKMPFIHLGDIAIAEQVAVRQARALGMTKAQEIIHLSHHGFLHLLGFDHERSKSEEKLMQHWEQILLDLTVLMRPIDRGAVTGPRRLR